MTNLISASFYIFSFLICLFFPSNVVASDLGYQEEMLRASVVEVTNEGVSHIESLGNQYENPYQNLKVKILDGIDKNQIVQIEHSGQLAQNFRRVEVGQTVVVNKYTVDDGSSQYQIIDRYRLDELLILAIFFLLCVVIMSRWKGLGSILGMLFSLLVIVKFIIPLILAGKDPLSVSIIGSIMILITSIYLAHGYSVQTTVAVVSTSITLIITGLLSVFFVNITGLSGISSEDTSSLLFGGPTATINFKGLLLGGMIIGFLGVLDDITTSMSATVFELKKVNNKLKFRKLVSSSLNVGREHISSLVNTLVLAYAGAALPLFLYLVLNPQNYPIWFMINTEAISEEIVRTLVGSVGLLFAVPITSLLASAVVSKTNTSV